MSEWKGWLLIALGVFAAGCQAPAGAPPAAETAGKAEPGQVAAYRVYVDRLRGVANSGLQLPAVSPDGRWVAFLDVEPEASVTVADLFTGRGLEGVSLAIATTEPSEGQRTIVSGGAAWPSWGAEGQRLVAVWYAEDGTARLVLYDLASGEREVLAPGVRRITGPRLSPSGRRVAFAGDAPDAARSRLYVMDLATRSLTMGPVHGEQTDYLMPYWLDEETLFCFAVRPEGVDMKIWPRGEQQMHLVGYTGVEPTTKLGLHQALAGLDSALDPSRRYLAYFEAESDQLVVIDLARGGVRELGAGTRAGAWLGPGELAVAEAGALVLHDLEGEGRRRELISGTTLPRWGRRETGVVLFLTPGESPWSFDLRQVRMEREEVETGGGEGGRASE